MVSDVDQVRYRLGGTIGWRADVGIVLGSGLGGIADLLLEIPSGKMPFDTLPGLAAPGITGHSGIFRAGSTSGLNVVIQQGRVHLYEGHSPSAVTAHVQLMIDLGIRVLILTNAAGGIRDGFQPGDFMLIEDSLSLPLLVANEERRVHPDQAARQRLAARHLWEPGLLALIRRQPLSSSLHQGTYAMMPGPAYETAAEVRMLRKAGIDAVGMSTIPEGRFAAVHGVSVLGISCITNVAAGLQEQPLSHEEVTKTGSAAQAELAGILRGLLTDLSQHLEDVS